jgi:anti-sigma regulatory factor (Ser/Thr protein kinase)
MGTHLYWSHHLLLPCEPVSVRRARLFVKEALDEHDLEHLADEVLLVVSELATNAAVHARTPFTVSAAGNTSMLFVRVRDRSPITPVIHDGEPTGGRAMAAPAVGGRGLLLVDSVSSSWGVDRGAAGKTVWASFARR